MSVINPEVRLLIAIPTMANIHSMLTSRLIHWGRVYPKVQVHFYFTFRVTPVERARNQIVKFFLETRVGPNNDLPLTHLLMIDSDTIPPADAIERLLSHGKDVVSGMTPILRYTEEKGWETYDNCFVALDRDENGKIITTHIAERNKGLKDIFRCGTACLLIKREVFDKLTPPYFSFITNEEGTTHIRSEDINFCDTVRAAGMDIYADTDVCCEHYKEIML